jgi:ribonuclease P protein component
MAPETSRPLKFNRAMHLKLGRDFSRVRREGQRLVNGCLIGNWSRLPAGSRLRLGVVVSSKVGNSVARSRARRLLRETFRVHQHDFTEPVDLVLIARPSIAAKMMADVERDFLTLLRKAGLVKQSNPSISQG